MSRSRISVLDSIQTSKDFFDVIYVKAYSNFIEEASVFNAMMVVVTCHALCEWLVAEKKTTWEFILENCNELRIIKSLSNHFKHKEETRNPDRPIQMTKANEPFVTPGGDYQLGSFIVYSDVSTESGLADGNNDLEIMLETVDTFLRGIVFNIPDIPF